MFATKTAETPGAKDAQKSDAIKASVKDALQSIEPLLTPDQTAASLGMSVKTLNVWRCTGRVNLPYVKVGARVRYRRADVDAYIARRTVTPNAPEAA